MSSKRLPSHSKLHTYSSTHTLTNSPTAKRDRLYTLIEDYHKSLSHIDISEVAAEENESGWLTEQLDFVKLLKKKLDKFQQHESHPKYSRLLQECEKTFNRLIRKIEKQPQVIINIDDECSSIEAVSNRKPKTKHTVAQSIDKLKQTITTKERLLQRNYQTEQSKNKQLASQIRHQQTIIDTLNREVEGFKNELAANATVVGHNQSMANRTNKQLLLLIKNNEEKDRIIASLELEVDRLRHEAQFKSECQAKQVYSERQMHVLMETNLQLKTNNHLLQLSVDKLRKTVEELNSQKDKISQSVTERLNSENLRLSQENKQLQSRLEGIVKQLDNLNITEQHISQLRQQNDDLRRHMVYKTKNMESLEGQLVQLREKTTELEDNHLQTITNLKQCRAEVRELQERCDLYKQKYFRLKQNLPEQSRTCRDTHIRDSHYSQTTQMCGNDLSTDRDRLMRIINHTEQQTKKLKVLDDLKSLVRTHRNQLEKLR